MVVSAATLAVTAALLCLRTAPSAVFALVPPCPLRLYLGLLCPGCGATHALAALLRGDLPSAWRSNALFVLLLPLAALYSLAVGKRLWAGATRIFPSLPSATMALLLVAASVFALLRNLGTVS